MKLTPKSKRRKLYQTYIQTGKMYRKKTGALEGGPMNHFSLAFYTVLAGWGCQYPQPGLDGDILCHVTLPLPGHS